MSPFIGTAGWSIPRIYGDEFKGVGSALQRYASRFSAVEVNSSFHHPHRPSTWARWASAVPDGFRFSVKLPKAITHERKLVDCSVPLAAFLAEVRSLGAKLALLLVQLPPKLEFDVAAASDFFALLASLTSVRAVCEPRHKSWFAPAAMKCSAAAVSPALPPILPWPCRG